MSKFIVIDGLDGSGKDTQIALLQKRFEHRRVAFTREPGGTPRAEKIRKILLEQTSQLADPLTDLLLFYAARLDHIKYLIEPMRAAMWHLITGRYDSSTFAFQLFGEGRYEQLIRWFDELRTEIVTDSVSYRAGMPDAYCFLDLPAEVAYARCRAVADEKTTVFDLKPLEYHQRVRDGFREFAKRYGDVRTEMFFIDANRSVEEVQAELASVIESVFEADDDNRDE